MRKTLEEMKARFPEGMDYVVSLDTNDFVKLSIEEVIHTLFEAVVLVVLVVYLFLQSFRTTIICTVAIVVSLIATFAGMLALGFSINLITLFGLVLAIGMVVDDAIVVVENVERNMHEHHLAPKEATIKSMDEIAGSLVAVVLVMASVFVPAAFLPGTTGQLYKQFAITIVVSVAVSGFVALTLTPAMCALMLKHSPPTQRGFFAWFNRQVDAVTRGFGHAVELVIKRWIVALVLLAVFLYSIYHLFTVLPDELRAERGPGLRDGGDHHAGGREHRPRAGGGREGRRDLREDPGRRDALDDHRLQPARQRLQDQRRRVLRDAQGLQGALRDDRDREGAERADRAADACRSEVQRHRTGRRDPDRAAADSRHRHDRRLRVLDPGHRRRRSGAARRRHAGIPRASARRGPSSRASTPRSARTRSSCARTSTATRRRCSAFPIEDVYSAIQAQFGSLTASQYNQFSRVWWVILQSDARYRQDPGDLTRLYTRSKDGQMVPLSALVTTQWVAGPDLLPHFNGFPAAKVNGNPAPGYSSGDAIAAMEATATEVLPPGYTFAWSGLAFEEKKSGGTSMIAFVFGLIIVFLVLAAQYESWTLPGAVMTAVPFGILGALVTNWLRGLENDVYFQIGLLVLIGLGAKNAVLRVSAAVEFRHQGKSIMEATILAGEQRLRPIIMTSLAFAFGCAAARDRARRRRQRAPLDRHRHHRRHDRRDHARDALRAAALLSLRPHGRGRRQEGRRAPAGAGDFPCAGSRRGQATAPGCGLGWHLVAP